MSDSADITVMNHKFCRNCRGTGQFLVDSDSVNEHFEVEKRSVLTPCTQCNGKGFFTDPPRPTGKI